MEENEVQESSAPAPGADSAAAVTTDSAAAADTSAAAAPDAQAAAPSEQGANDAKPQRTLESVREKYRKAAEEEARKAEASPTTDKAETKEPAEEPKGESDEEAGAAEAEAAEHDPLAEFEEPKPLTREEIDEKHPRIPKAVREQWAASEEQRGTLLKEREEIGGEQGVAFARAVAPAVWAAEPGEKEADALLDAVTDANPSLAAATSQRLIRVALDDAEVGPAFGESLIREWLGEDLTFEKVRKLVALDRAGAIDWEGADEDLAAANAEQASDEVARLREEVATLKTQLQQPPDRRRQQAGADEERQKDERAVDDYVSDRAVSAVLPIAIKQGLAARDDEEGAEDRVLFGEILTAWLNEKVKAFPEYAQIRSLKKAGGAFQKGEASALLKVHTDSLEKRSRALFLETVRKLRSSQTIPVPRPAPDKPKPPTDGDGGEKPQTPRPREAEDVSKLSYEERMERIREKHRRAAADEQARAGVARR